MRMGHRFEVVWQRSEFDGQLCFARPDFDLHLLV